ncbi:MAG: hypothetical protein KDA99_29575, partial [Planctomycetales bacterium]|nr:hypothetical protein [Planctomycetales bacterium]
DLFDDAQRLMRVALPGLRVVHPLPPDDNNVKPWTIGYVHGDNAHRAYYNIMTDSRRIRLDISSIGNAQVWGEDDWNKHIFDPIRKYAMDWHKWLDSLKTDGETDPPHGLDGLPGNRLDYLIDEKKERVDFDDICQFNNDRHRYGGRRLFENEDVTVDEVANGFREVQRQLNNQCNAYYQVRVLRKDSVVVLIRPMRKNA